MLESVSFVVREGEALAVLGPNGIGKSTLLRCVVGADLPDAGTAAFGDLPLIDTDPGIRAAVATVLDDMDFFADLSVVEHLELLALAHGAPASSAAEAVREFGLEEVCDHLPAALSGGQRRRLALASCFVRPRRLLVLDEPEQRLDTDARARLVARLLREKQAGIAILFASHDPALVDALADARLTLGR